VSDSSPLTAVLSERYVIERELGSGGMAVVYLAHDRKLDREVALKVLRPELGAVLGSERFLPDIKISARLDHPHILTLIDSGDADGMLYYVLPYVRGETLRDKFVSSDAPHARIARPAPNQRSGQKPAARESAAAVGRRERLGRSQARGRVRPRVPRRRMDGQRRQAVRPV
jgi:serine/threonine protein kinase